MKRNKNEIIDIVIEYAKKHEISNLTVSLVADISSVTRRTLYRYFENKNKLLFEVFKTCIYELNKKILQYRQNYFDENPKLSDFEKIYYGLKSLIEASMENPHYVKIIVECDSILKSEANLRSEFKEVVGNMDYIIGLLDEAQKSNELSKEVDTDQLAFLIYDTSLGLIYRNIITRDKYDNKLESENVYNIIDALWLYIQTYKI